jgi:hypothetical protein
MQLNQTQPEPLTALLQLNFCYQLQTALVPPDAQLSCYSSVATTFYPTLVFSLFGKANFKENSLQPIIKFLLLATLYRNLVYFISDIN